MKEAFISDVHAKYDRLTRAVSRLKEHGYDRLRCLGDVVGDYAADEWVTHQCVDLIKKECDLWILGNHDEAAQLRNRFKAECIKEYLTSARRIVHEQDVVYAHTEPAHRYGPDAISQGSYVDTTDAARRVFDRTTYRLAFLGHTHVPAAFGSDGSRHDFPATRTMQLDKRLRWILTVGAVESSRDGPCAAVFDHDAWTLTVIRG
ncbi:MAG TPA: metallophosphoesterase family protein [Candidatus Binatia bacterium]|nr:metallophosphoesterase family protein [Candidatus Binatia bacterium]